MNVKYPKIFSLLLFLCVVLLYPVWGQQAAPISTQALALEEEAPVLIEEETAPRYPVQKTYPETYTDLQEASPLDLPQPENIKTSVEYDPATGNYYFNTKVGDEEVGSPFYLSKDEYINYSSKASMQAYFREKTRDEKKKKGEFSLTDIKFGIGEADQVFGPGGVQVKLQGSVELLFGLNFKKLEDPSLSERLQNPSPTFDFDEKLQLNVDGSVGDRIKFGLNYNTEATFDFDQSMLKLAYEGKEDDIIRKIEAGNVSMPLAGTLITGNQSLFGFKTELQIGKLNIEAVISQQESDGTTMNMSGAQTNDFDIKADEYDENRHFFLSHYFREHYDEAMADLPNISSGVQISEIEVWVTNKKFVNYDDVTNVVGFADIGEPERIYNPAFAPTGSPRVPSNRANTLYANVVQSQGGLPEIYNIDAYLRTFNMESDVDFVKVEGARKLDANEYTINRELGYISLKTSVSNDEMLGVAYQYTYKGEVYSVGEMSITVDPTKPIALKLLKSTDNTPNGPSWHLMMKNIYSLGAYQVQSDGFVMDVMYRNDSTGVSLRYLSDGPVAKETLLRVMNLDNLDSRLQSTPKGNGVFDFVPDYTILARNGRIIFPVIEPFGSHLALKLGNDPDLIDKYVYQELYDSTLVVAQELAEKNKFSLVGEYRASSSSEIRLNAMNIPRGSVQVTAGGRILVENIDYTVDYMMGVITIVDQNIIDLGTPISVTMESQSMFNTQQKSLLGTHLDYAFTDNLNVGATLMYLSQKPLTEKVSYGEDPVANTMWGLNASYREQFESLTDMMNKIPIFNLQQASTLSIDAEFAQMIPGHPSSIEDAGTVYIDDFEATRIGFDVHYPKAWKLASTPSSSLFPESQLSNSIEYGKNRAHLAWYYIDPMFTRSTSTTPSYIQQDKDQLSNHFIREISEQEIFPNRELVYGQSSYIQTMSMAFYPKEVGPYNIYGANVGADGFLTSPSTKWGGVMRQLDITDFETNNVDYLEFWVLDPFVYNDGSMSGGDLYFNLGNISEDILKDGRKQYENGLPVDGGTDDVVNTVWGEIPTKQSIAYTFDATEAGRAAQDVGFDGLSTEKEKEYDGYKIFVDYLTANLDPLVLAAMQVDEYSLINDPASDDFRHYRGDEYDANETSIFDRYKYYNGVEGNSPSSTNASYTEAASNDPDIEDINEDNTMTETERYYEYKVSIRPGDMVVGNNFISDVQEATVELANGESSTVKWYQFKVPLRDPNAYSRVGSINSFKSIRFMRMYMTGFEDTTMLRFASMELVKGEWRNYTKALETSYYDESGTMEVSSVSIEENASKTPVNYVLPPGVSREIDPSQQQIRQENEQSMSIKVNNLSPKDARAVYKKIGGYDMRYYERLQMSVHAEAFADDITNLEGGDLSIFVRLGSDYQSNYYEYEIPLNVTPPAPTTGYSNNSTADRTIVWPEENRFDFPFEILTDLKLRRNEEKARQGSAVSNLTSYSDIDPDKPNNKISILGNPTLGEVDVIMVGIRNKARVEKGGEMWINELRLSGFDEEGGVAARANIDFALSDFISVNLAGRIETEGFGGIEQSVSERRLDNFYQYNVNLGMELGKFFPDKASVLMPVRYSFSQEISNPKYNPIDDDVLLTDALDNAADRAQRDSILLLAQSTTTNQSLSIPSIRVGIVGENGPRPWDPANFSVGGSYSEIVTRTPTMDHAVEEYYNAYGAYEFNWNPKPVEPFAKIKALNKPAWKWLKEFGFNYAPKRFAYKTDFTRRYYEQMVRDFDGTNSAVLEPTFDKDFIWTNSFDVAWDLTKNLKLTLTTNKIARIVENDGGVNRELYPDEFEMWKDSVRNSLAELGTPMDYNQHFSANWKIPFNKSSITNWITANLKYDGSYNWIHYNDSIANTATSEGSFQVNGKLNFESLYNKSPYAKRVNRRYGSSRSSRKQKKPKVYEKEMLLTKGDTLRLSHRLNNKKVTAYITSAKGRKIRLKYKVLNKNTISFVAPVEGTASVKVTTRDHNSPKNVAQDVSARVGMMLRNISFNYKQTDGTIMPGFKPEATIFGTSSYNGEIAPGFDFLFGFQDDKFLDKALRNDWLVTSDALFQPAEFIHTETFKITALVEPFAGFKINIGADRLLVQNRTVQYNTNSQLTTLGGNFSMSYIAIGTSFKGTSGRDFDSDLYSNFLAYRGTVKSRLEDKYNPTTSYQSNSDDVLVPAFLAAYAGRDPDEVDLSGIPSFWSFLPNWQVSFDGLLRIPWVKENFRRLSITHAYNCSYQVGSYSSDLSFESVVGDEFGYIEDVLNDDVLPSSRYLVNTVSLSEKFSPLIGVDVSLKNSFSLSLQWRKSRTLALNLASNQIVENYTDEYVVGLGYRFSDLNFSVKSKNKKKKVKNDLSLRADFSMGDSQTLIRKIELDETQATSGDLVTTFELSADYVFSERISFRLFYDLQMRTPLVTTSYPTTISEVGISVKLLLNQ